MTGLTPQTVSNITAEFVDTGLIREVGRRKGGKGQPALEYAVDGEGAYTIGVHLDQQRIVGIVVNVLGEIVERAQVLVASQNPEQVLGQVERVVETLVPSHTLRRNRLLGVGVVMPGFFERGVFVSYGPLSMEGWLDFPVGEKLSRRLRLPVYVDNDATAAAVGESLYGWGHQLRSFVYIYFGLGVGGGIIVDGQPYAGVHQRAAEVGHLIVNPGGKVCACGSRGCLERYISLFSAYEAFLHSESELEAATPEYLLAEFEKGNPALERWLEDAAYYLRIAVNQLENMLDPGGVVMGGVLPGPILTALIDKVRPLKPSIVSRSGSDLTRLAQGKVVVDTPSIGAAALPMSYLLHPATQERLALHASDTNSGSNSSNTFGVSGFADIPFFAGEPTS